MSLDPQKAARLARLALKRARAYFKVDPTWDIKLKAESLEQWTAAEIERNTAYRRATVSYDPGQADSPAELWGHIGHEVAHILLAQLDVLQLALKESGRWDDSAQFLWTHGVENSVMTLQAMWERDCPMPKDAWK